jgi:hypothetical protein
MGPGREADHSHPSSAEVKECVELYLHSPNMPSWRGTQLKHRENFTFYVHGVKWYCGFEFLMVHDICSCKGSYCIGHGKEVGLEVNAKKTKYIFVPSSECWIES